ncbi:alpha/beta hydrolase [Sphingobium aromaticiconvertens]|uniref:alpha/beta fold hydrolase n=1 Tax=Sphingobium aromaticiconvertens TaxID=365341 RepID=UPI00301928F3
MIDRDFVSIAEGPVHMRRLRGPGRPLLFFHPSPNSSRGLVPVMEALRAAGCDADMIAIDTLGNGDSPPPGPEVPDIAYFADAMRRVMDALGLDRADLYGSHTGARIACELAATCPDRVDRVIFQGISDFDPATRAKRLEAYAPAMEADDYGRQFVWAFNFVRDQSLHTPYFLRDPEHRLMNRAVPDAANLHAAALDVLKNLTCYHKPYRAAFAYPTAERIRLVMAPTLFIRLPGLPPHIAAAAPELGAMMADARVVDTADEASAITTFLNR